MVDQIEENEEDIILPKDEPLEGDEDDNLEGAIVEDPDGLLDEPDSEK